MRDRTTIEEAPVDLATEMALRKILAEEIKERGGPVDWQTMLANRWMEVDSELPPELSSAIAAMKRAYNAGVASTNQTKPPRGNTGE